MSLLTTRLSTSSLALLFMVASAAAWGTGTVMSKYSLNYFPPFILFVVQLSASVVVLWSLVWVRRLQPPMNINSLRLGSVGLLEPGLAFVLALVGLSRTTASVASFIGATEYFLVVVFAYFILRERVTRRTLLLILLTLVGVILISVNGEESGAHSLAGDLLVLGGTASAALYVVLSRSAVSEMQPIPLAALQHTFGLLFGIVVLPLGLAGGELQSLTAIPLSIWLWAILNGIVQYMLAFLFYLNALKGMPATRAALYLALIPVFGTVESVIFLGEQLSWVQLVGGLLILGALLALKGQQTASAE